MKRITLLLIVLVLASLQTRAQAITPAPPATTTDAGRLIIQFSQAIVPNSFTDQWSLKSNSWTSTAAKNPNGAALAKNALFLTNYIKPAMFKSTFNLKNFTKAANSAKTYPDAYKVLQSLEDGLKREAFTGRWPNQRGHWLHDLSVLK
jgi:hypothetical protein